MTTWNYRIVHMDESYPEEPWYELHEVYYTKNGCHIKYWTENPVTICGETQDEVLQSLLVMALDATRRPVLKESNLPGGKKKGRPIK